MRASAQTWPHNSGTAHGSPHHEMERNSIHQFGAKEEGLQTQPWAHTFYGAGSPSPGKSCSSWVALGDSAAAEVRTK